MVNTRLLRGKIEEKGTNISEVASQMGVDKATLYRRIQNSETFTIGEVGKITEILCLTKDEAVSIFLIKMSHNCDKRKPDQSRANCEHLHLVSSVSEYTTREEAEDTSPLKHSDSKVQRLWVDQRNASA